MDRSVESHKWIANVEWQRIVTIHSLVLVRRFGVKRFPAVISHAAPCSTGHSSHAQFFAIGVCRELVRFRLELSVEPSQPNQNPSTVGPTSTKCHTDRQPQHGQKSHQPSTFDLTRHDAATIVRPPMVAPITEVRKFPSRFAGTLRCNDYVLTAGRTIEKLSSAMIRSAFVSHHPLLYEIRMSLLVRQIIAAT